MADNEYSVNKRHLRIRKLAEALLSVGYVAAERAPSAETSATDMEALLTIAEAVALETQSEVSGFVDYLRRQFSPKADIPAEEARDE